MFSRRQILDIFLVIVIASVVFLLRISETDAGLWEPWETATILVARQISQSGMLESTFWVPQLDGELVAQPYLHLWSLSWLLHSTPDPSVFMLRLPSAIAGIFLTVLFFGAMRMATSSRTAWVSTLVLLTIPMFVFGGKLLHGDIWLILAISLPCLLYIMSIYATTRRMQRTMISISGLSLTISFLSGGLFALGVLAVIAAAFFILTKKHPQRTDIFWPLGTRYFLLPLYLSFVVSATVFGIYMTHARYALEHRDLISLPELNVALDEDRVSSLEQRGVQIIGMYRSTGFEKDKPFVLVESKENLNTNSEEIFNLNENEHRSFENYVSWRFGKLNNLNGLASVPPMGDALSVTLKFFVMRTNSPFVKKPAQLARLQEAVTLQLAGDRDSAVNHLQCLSRIHPGFHRRF